jgi:RNA polymerase sigma-70 factor, ECF subfamily
VTDEALNRLAREDSGRVRALLASRFGDLDLADDAVQDALIEAARTWPSSGVPSNPGGWLLTVARRKAVDRLRRDSSARRRTLAAAPDLVTTPEPTAPSMIDDTEDPTDDEHLRLVLLCCHPALDIDAQVALTLRLVGGLSTDEIAAAFIVPEPTMAQRIVRAKRKIRDAAIPLSMPRNLDGRVDAVLKVLYLVFNEGYLARGSSDRIVRTDLVVEALRLTRVVAALLPDDTEAAGLLALQLYAVARSSTRLDAAGDLALLADQDRSAWDLRTISEANAVLGQAMQAMRPGPFQLQAVIAGLHANARTAADTDWPSIARAYAQLATLTPSPVVALNHAVAVAMSDGPLVGLGLLDRIEGIDSYHLLHATRGELLLRADDPVGARAAFVTARTLTRNSVEQRHLDRRIAQCTG